MSMEASGGGTIVGTSDRSGGNNVGPECRIGMDQIIEESSGLRFSEEEMKQFDSFEKASKVVVDKAGPLGHDKPKIQLIPHQLRYNKNLEEYFVPKMFSFGPVYPYREDPLAKQIKVNLAAKFLQQNGVKKEDLYVIIHKQIKKLKECYIDRLVKYEDHELAWMFLKNGCAILQFMSDDSQHDRVKQFRKLGIRFDYELFLGRDLFLLENQLPYQLLQLIIRSTSNEDELLKSIYMFIFSTFRKTERWHKNKDEFMKDLNHNHVHLLDLLRKKLIQPLHQKDHEKRDHIEIIINWIVVLFDKLKCNRNEFDLVRVSVPRRNIGKLREAGINLKSSKTSCVGDITFSGGTLKLPFIDFAEPTAACFLNMLGYEMCRDFQNKSEITTYMYIMDILINQTQDVEELREKYILRNQGIGSDEEMVKLFNEISTKLIPDFDRYSKLESDINDYFDNKGLMWLCKVSHDIHQYFKGRWSLLAFIAALLAVASTIIQTVFTILAYQTDSNKGR